MADGTTFVKVTSTQSTPEDYLLSGAASLDLLAVRADFDGSGAGGDFLPVVQIVNEADEIMLTFVGEKVTAGDSASFTFAPFLKGVSSSAVASGIQFDTNPQAGDSLFTETTGPSGTMFRDDGGGIYLISTASGGGSGFVELSSDAQVEVLGELFKVRTFGNPSGPGDVSLQNTNLDCNDAETIDFTATTRISLTSPEVQMAALPTSPPGPPAGQLWNNGGVINIT